MAVKRQIKILLLPKYTDAGPSSRYRFYQYCNILKGNNINFRIRPLFSGRYVNTLYSIGRINHFEAIVGYLKRLFIIFTFLRYDLIIIEYELLPYFPAFFEKLCRMFRIDYIVDYDDAIFTKYTHSSNYFIRLFLGRKIEKVIKSAQAVIAGNKYLFDYASKHNGNVYIIPTVVSYRTYDDVSVPEKTNRFVLGWIGSPTSSKFLVPLSSLFRNLSKEGIQINIIGCDEKLKHHFEGADINWIEWTQDSEIKEIKKFSAGIMPLNEDFWSKGKCGFKLIQYMACKLPVITSPVGINKELVEDGINGFHANSTEDWMRSVSYLADNREKSFLMGQKGYARFRENYSLEAISEKYISIIRSLIT
jgi:glycosyltransferase involved in cell wall biosynthesis